MSIWSDNKEVVRIKVKKTDGLMQPEYKNLCVDPQLTTLEMLQCLLVKAFDITSDFTMSYLARDDTGEEVYLSLLSDWDLDAAFFGASNPCLHLKVDLKPFEEVPDDWDIITPMPPDVRRSPTRTLISTSNIIIGSLSKTVSNVTKAIGLRQEEAPIARENRLPSKPAMSDAEFHNFLDPVGSVIQPEQFRLAVYQSGVEPSLRSVVWRHLLNIYPHQLTGRERFDYLRGKSNEYYRLRDEWRSRGESDESVRQVAGMVRKDVLRTDRLHPFYAGDSSPNGTALFNLLVTYALTHPRLSYWQGMSDIASPILAVEGDEANAYVCFCALMARVGASFAADGVVMATRFQQLELLLRHFDPDFYDCVRRCGAADMFFTYRWLLLEMKREFPLDDAMFALEVMWSTLPLAPTDDLPLFDPAYRESNAAKTCPSPASHTEAYVHLRTTQRRVSGGNLPFESPAGHAPTNSVNHRKGSMDGTPCGHAVLRSVSETAVAPNNNFTDVVRAITDDTTKDDGLEEESLEDDSATNNVDHFAKDEASRKRCNTNDSDDVNEKSNLLAPLDSVSVDFTKTENGSDGKEAARLPPLPPPSELGCGNPFLMFLCLSTLLLQRHYVLSSCSDYNDIAMHYDKLVRQHRVEHVVNYARQLYAMYLRQQQQMHHNTPDADDEEQTI